jgi:hypothetical protein
LINYETDTIETENADETRRIDLEADAFAEGFEEAGRPERTIRTAAEGVPCRASAMRSLRRAGDTGPSQGREGSQDKRRFDLHRRLRALP